MLAKLSDFLRTTLVADPQGTVGLGQELAMLETNHGIESVRFRDRLCIQFACPSELEEATVPSFLLQPLVENAVKYAVSPTKRRVTLRIAAAEVAGDLVITVADDGDPAKAAGVRKGTGLGLANVRQRLDVLYGERATFNADPRADGFCATVRLPLAITGQCSKMRPERR